MRFPAAILTLVIGALLAPLLTQAQAPPSDAILAEAIPMRPAWRAPLAAGELRAVVRATALPGGASIEVPARLLPDRDDQLFLFARLSVPASGDYRLEAIISTPDAEPQGLLLASKRRFDVERWDVCLVIDSSWSMRENDPRNLRAQAMARFLELARESRSIQSLALVTFSGEAQTRMALTPVSELADAPALQQPIGASGSTNYDAAFVTTESVLMEATGTRRAVIFLSDGEHQGVYGHRHMSLQQRGWPVYAIGLSKQADTRTLKLVAEDTGGRYFAAPRAEDLGGIFEQIFYLIDRPHSLWRQNVSLQGGEQLALRIDPSIRRWTVDVHSLAGELDLDLQRPGGEVAATGRVVDGGQAALQAGGQATVGEWILKMHGQGRAAVNLQGDAELWLEGRSLAREAAAGRPLKAVAWLTGPGLARASDIRLVVDVLRADGSVVSAENGMPRGELDLYSAAIPMTAAGQFQLRVVAMGRYDGQPFARAVMLAASREGLAASALGPGTAMPTMRIGGPVAGPTLAPRELSVGGPASSGPSARSESRVTFVATPPTLDLGELVPGVSASASTEVAINGLAAESPVTVELLPGAPEFLSLDGQVQAVGGGRLTLRAEPPVGLTPGPLAAALRVRSGYRYWDLAVTGERLRPSIAVSAEPMETGLSEDRQSVLVAQELAIHLEPGGRVPMRLSTDVAALSAEPAAWTAAGTTPQTVTLRGALARSTEAQTVTGSITVAGDGLATVRIPFELVVEPLPPVREAAETPVPIQQTGFGWGWLWLLAVLLLAMLIWAALRGRRRLVYVAASVLLHVLAFLLMIPSVKPEPSAETRPTGPLVVSTGGVVVEQMVQAEVASFDASDAAAAELAAAKAAAELAAAETSEAAQAVEPTELTAEERAEMATEQPAPESPTADAPTPEELTMEAESPELRRAEAETTAASAQTASQAEMTPAPVPELQDEQATELQPAAPETNTPGEVAANAAQAPTATDATGELAPAAEMAPTIEAAAGRSASHAAPGADRQAMAASGNAAAAGSGQAATPAGEGAGPAATIQIGEATVSGSGEALETTARGEAESVSPTGMSPTAALAPSVAAGPRRHAESPGAESAAAGPSTGSSETGPVVTAGPSGSAPSAAARATVAIGDAPGGASGTTLAADGRAIDGGEELTGELAPGSLGSTPAAAPGRRAATASTGDAADAIAGGGQAPVATGIMGRQTERPGQALAPTTEIPGAGSGRSRPEGEARDGTGAIPAPSLAAGTIPSGSGDAELPAKRAASGPAPRAAGPAGPRAIGGRPVAIGAPATADVASPGARELAVSDAPAPELAIAADSDLRRPPSVSPVAGDAARPRGAWENTLPVVRYDGDWDCDATAMLHLAHQLERRTGSLMPLDSRSVPLDDPEMRQAPFLFMTGHKPFTFADAEITNLRQYLSDDGGFMWINDSTDLGDQKFDAAVRREIARVIPGAEWRRIPADHPIFRGPYDLTGGYMGYAVPPGDKYRQDYLEGLWIDDRLAIVYTRNDYGDGLEIDPRTHPLMSSLSDLSPQDMQEGSVQMGINITSFFMADGRAPDAAATRLLQAHARDVDRTRRDWAAQPVLHDALDAPDQTWDRVEGWDDLIPAELTRDPATADLIVRFGGSGPANRRQKAVISTQPGLALGADRALLLDVQSGMRGGARLAIAVIDADGKRYLESAPVFVKPGANTNLVIDLSQPTFKSAETEWRYEAPFPQNLTPGWLFIILYPQEQSGQIRIHDLRVIAPPATD